MTKNAKRKVPKKGSGLRWRPAINHAKVKEGRKKKFDAWRRASDRSVRSKEGGERVWGGGFQGGGNNGKKIHEAKLEQGRDV